MAKLSPEQINVLSVRAYYDNKTFTNTTEMTNLLKYESQHFRCKVQLEISECIADRCWSIGLVQACDRMYLENRYGHSGSSFWEFHPLKSGRHKMVNDSDGRQYPFYSLTSSKFEIRRGVVSDSLVALTYEDHFYPTVAWELPYYGGAKLTDVIRKQDFWVWLVAIKRASSRSASCDVFNAKHDEVYILKTMRWRYGLHMTFDPHQPVGKRLQRIYDVQEEQPIILESNRPLPLSALSPPHCNAAQSLIWYPNNPTDKPKLLVPPKQIIVPWETWTNDMAPGRALSVKKPDQCKLVGEWAHDTEIGIDVSPAAIKSGPSSRGWKAQGPVDTTTTVSTSRSARTPSRPRG
ncbi:Tetratricopeptide helical [Paragonimus skrjabini miyazakii]|uniref:Tetratricopeptide helical n=1 Tax=Paragonimus skrjabini miyazakii TaxID=59628 RepID=A0A8S9YIQ5_9TREM|nr:Tetratricopeptide helical [Paragonimus skrjabini miyazakii]